MSGCAAVTTTTSATLPTTTSTVSETTSTAVSTTTTAVSTTAVSTAKLTTKHYKNPAYGFSFDYPAGWKLDQQGIGDPATGHLGNITISALSSMSGTTINLPFYVPQFLQRFWPGTNAQAVQGMYAEEIAQRTSAGESISASGLKRVSMRNAEAYEWTISAGSTRYASLVVIASAWTCEISAQAPASLWQRAKPLFDAFFASFAVVPPPVTTTTSAPIPTTTTGPRVTQHLRWGDPVSVPGKDVNVWVSFPAHVRDNDTGSTVYRVFSFLVMVQNAGTKPFSITWAFLNDFVPEDANGNPCFEDGDTGTLATAGNDWTESLQPGEAVSLELDFDVLASTQLRDMTWDALPGLFVTWSAP